VAQCVDACKIGHYTYAGVEYGGEVSNLNSTGFNDRFANFVL
jgi:hypothetical protein